MSILADGSAELALSGGDFFREVWINQTVINNVEIFPMGVHSLEFDAAVTVKMSFTAMTPGSYSRAFPARTATRKPPS